MPSGWGSFFSPPSLLLVTILESFYVAIADSCSYSSLGDVHYYSCLSYQYCCGHDSCCLKSDYYYSVYDLWYFWFCICFGIFICSLAGGAYYRKRQLHTVRVAAIPVGHHAGHAGGMQGQYVRGAQHTYHAPPRNVFVAATSASGQPMYHIGMNDIPPPNYSMFTTGIGGPVYPAYACNMPPPSYSSLNTPTSEATNATMGASATTSPPMRGGQDTASFPEAGPPVPSSADRGTVN